jgi:nucleoside 2-deoxyribosyltransferase
MYRSNQKVKVFLSGPIEHEADDGRGWRSRVQTELLAQGYDVFNPLDSSDKILSDCNVKSAQEYNQLKKDIHVYENLVKYREITRHFVDIDLYELRTSHIVLAKVSAVASGGTAGELTVARMLDIPVVAFCNEPLQTVSGWVLSVPDVLFHPPYQNPEKCALDYLMRTTDEMIKLKYRAKWL